MKLSQFTTLSFDCYGTLIDWEAGLSDALAPLREQSAVSGDAILERFGRIEHELQEESPGLRYAELLARAHERLSAELGIASDPGGALAFGQSVGDWPAFADSAEALAYLKGHFRLVILSNVDRQSFAGSNRRLGVQFDHIFTAEEIGSYKPDPRNFQYLLDRMGEIGVERGQLLHVAQSLFHDHVPANSFGIASAWIDRRAGKGGGGATVMPDPLPRYDFRYTSLGELAEAHRAEIG
ncbi:haloacid dehalogenase type II [Sphingomonas sp. RB56-2]|uniref:Haloacid dehalogenase type II n=1 Tax=Sphingomonas brevis TaxID=2908206 RepID=A0ABT0S8E8_9SPHN|nr:haloacid dehalogenase type II [Sphingomonas brevis]MCL6740658.1 haloacid dehalogenase type II [Sphingomonas brevis]